MKVGSPQRLQPVVVPGLKFGRPRVIRWSNSYTGEETATAEIMFDLEGPENGWLCIKIGGLDQHIHLVAGPRHFGGGQARCGQLAFTDSKTTHGG